jgi:hypothetical protein
LPHAHLPKENRAVENVIARRTPAIAPFSLDIVGRVPRADLLTVTVDAAIRSVDTCALLDHSRLRHRIDVCAFLVRLRIEVSDLPVRNHRQSEPGESERPEDSKEKRSETFH